jgi:hypothetical protein
MSYYTSHKVNGWSVRPQEVYVSLTEDNICSSNIYTL